MQPNKFKYYLRKFNGTNYTYYSVNSSNVIVATTSATPVNPLRYAPNGWTDKEPIWKRGMEYHGIFTTYAQPLKFVRDGRIIMRSEHYTNGSEAELEIYIEALNESTYTYALFYYGEFDFSTFIDYEDDCQCNIRDGGFLTKFSSRSDNPYEFDLTDNANVKYVMIDGGTPLITIAEFTGLDQPNDGSGVPAFDFPGGVTLQGTLAASDALVFPTCLPFPIEGFFNPDVDNKGNPFTYTLNAEPFQTVATGFITVSMGDKYFFRNLSNTKTYDVRVKGKLNIGTVASSSSSTRCRLRMLRAVHNTDTILQDALLANGVWYLPSNSGIEDINFDTVFTLAPNECLWLYFRYDNGGTGEQYHIYSLEMTATLMDFVAPVYVPFIELPTAFNQIIEKIGDNTTTVDTSWLTSSYPRLCITSGDGLRQLPKAQIKYSFDELYQSINYNLNTSAVYNRPTDELVIQDKALAYDDTVQIVDFGEVSMFETSPLTDEMHSQLKIGYQNFDYDAVNGKEEVNSTLIMSSPMKKTTEVKDMVSPFRSDITGIAMTIKNLTDKLIADNENDNDVFMLDIDTSAVAGQFDLNGTPTDYYNLYRDPINLTPGASYFELQNLFRDNYGNFSNQDKLFNLFFSPKRMIRRNANYLASIMYFVNSQDYTFVTTGKNTADNDRLITLFSTGPTVIDEGSDEIISALCLPTNALYMPLKAKIKCKIPVNLINIIQTNPYGLCAFSWKGITYYGYLLQASQKVAESQEGNIELIMSANSNLSTLIN